MVVAEALDFPGVVTRFRFARRTSDDRQRHGGSSSDLAEFLRKEDNPLRTARPDAAADADQIELVPLPEELSV
jgi:hypothetical protein